MIDPSPNQERNWYILYTLTKHEKRVNQFLEKFDIESYLPLQMVWRQWSDRKKKIEVPLFPNYVFMRSRPEELYKVLTIPGVLKYLSNSDGPEKVDDLQIRFIKNILNEDFQITTHSLTEGDIVEFISGPFSGLQGILLRQSCKSKVAVTIRQLNRTITVETGSYRLEKVMEKAQYLP